MGTPFLAIFILFFSFSACAQEAKTVFTDSMEQEFYEAVKDQGKGHSEAEIEQAVGVGILNMDDQWERAQKHFKKAVRLDPSLYLAWYDLGIIHIDSEEGMGYFRKAIEVKPDYPPAYYWIAYYYTRYGKFKKALPTWKDYLRAATAGTAKGEQGELDRINTAKEVVKEIESGKPGEALGIIHLH